MRVKRIFCVPWPYLVAKFNFDLRVIHADWRFVMTKRYDFPFFEGRKVNNTLDFIEDGAR